MAGAGQQGNTQVSPAPSGQNTRPLLDGDELGAAALSKVPNFVARTWAKYHVLGRQGKDELDTTNLFKPNPGEEPSLMTRFSPRGKAATNAAKDGHDALNAEGFKFLKIKGANEVADLLELEKPALKKEAEVAAKALTGTKKVLTDLEAAMLKHSRQVFAAEAEAAPVKQAHAALTKAVEEARTLASSAAAHTNPKVLQRAEGVLKRAEAQLASYAPVLKDAEGKLASGVARTAQMTANLAKATEEHVAAAAAHAAKSGALSNIEAKIANAKGIFKSGKSLAFQYESGLSSAKLGGPLSSFISMGIATVTDSIAVHNGTMTGEHAGAHVATEGAVNLVTGSAAAWAGAESGAVVGTAIGGPLGTIVGGAVGAGVGLLGNIALGYASEHKFGKTDESIVDRGTDVLEQGITYAETLGRDALSHVQGALSRAGGHPHGSSNPGAAGTSAPAASPPPKVQP